MARLNDAVAEALDEEGLEAIPGVGTSIAAKILELRDHGSFDELDELRAKIPAGVRPLLTVPGLGPKRAMELHDELGVSSIPELLDAIHHRALEALPGLGPKTEENLARAIQQVREAGGRIQLGTALDLAEQVLAVLLALPEVEQATYAGSLRRTPRSTASRCSTAPSSTSSPTVRSIGTTSSSRLSTSSWPRSTRISPSRATT